jgi:hypothetical protein
MGYTLRTTRETVRTKQPKTKGGWVGLDYTHYRIYRRKESEGTVEDRTCWAPSFQPAAVRRRIHYSTARLFFVCPARLYKTRYLDRRRPRLFPPPLYSTRVLAL